MDGECSIGLLVQETAAAALSGPGLATSLASLGSRLIDYGAQREGPESLRTLRQESTQAFEAFSKTCPRRLRHAFRRLLVRVERTRQEWNRIGKPLSTVAIASPRAGAGRSFLARNLAAELSLGESARVLLVEADTANPSFSSAFGVGASQGLRDALSSPDWRPCLSRVDETGLFILPLGGNQGTLAELAADGRLARFAEQASRRFDWVIFDGPSLESSDGELLARHCDGVIVVLETDPGSVEGAREAVAKIEADRLVGMVLNRT
ncbi:MAG: CpsD/CapB family tyrosine-protein kinase [Bryobacteraceae bacterium]